MMTESTLGLSVAEVEINPGLGVVSSIDVEPLLIQSLSEDRRKLWPRMWDGTKYYSHKVIKGK